MRKNLKKIFTLCLLIVMLLICCKVRINVAAENGMYHLKKTYYVKSFEELKKAVKSRKKGTPLNIILESDISCGEDTLYVNGNVHINLNGHILYKEGSTPLFYLGNKKQGERTKITKNLEIKPMQYPEEFIVKVEDTGKLKKGQKIYISDTDGGEMNVISCIVNKNKLLLKERPCRIYSSKSGTVEALVYEEGNLTIQNGQIKTNDEKNKKIVKESMEETIAFTKSKSKDSMIVINSMSNVKLSDVEIINKNFHQNTIAVLRSENVVVDNCYIEGGRNAIILGENSQNCKITNNAFYDCSAAIFLFGNNNLITDNSITSSGATVKFGDGITILGSASYNTIRSNQIIGGNCYGIWGLEGKRSGNSIIDNVIQANITYGIYLEGGGGYLIENNRMERNSGGICIDGISNSVISDNFVSNNLISGISIGAKVKKCIVENNILSGNNYVDPNIAGYGGDIVIWENPDKITVKDNKTEQEIRIID